MIRMKVLRLLALALPALTIGGCGLLDVSDPTVVQESDLANADGAEQLRRHVVPQLYEALGYGARYSALFSDEMFALPSASSISAGTIVEDALLDQRDGAQLAERWFSNGGQVFRSYELTRVAATHALQWFYRYGTAAQRPHVGQLYTVRGYAIVNMAEQLCGGFALHGLDNGRPVYKPPLTTAEVFAAALVDLDSAVVAAQDSARLLNFAKVVRGRALLGLGRFAEAAQAVAGVPDNFEYNAEYGASPGKTNRLRLTFSKTANNIGVSDREGGNGLDFRTAGDPRVPVTLLGTGHDNVTRIYTATKNQELTSPIAMATGIEARLIEAEAALRANDTNWLTILNHLRATRVTPALAPLADPGTADARVDLLFRERAFWLFLSGHRLGDLRRLVTHYGRTAESVFPSGTYFLGGTYQNATSIPFAPANEEMARTGVTGCKA